MQLWKVHPSLCYVFLLLREADDSVISVFGDNQRIKVCEFHVFQAIERWVGNTSLESVQSERPSKAMRKRIVQLFKPVLGSTSAQDFDKRRSEFFEGVAQLCSSFERFKAIFEYFQVHWFCPAWLRALYSFVGILLFCNTC